MGRTTGIGFVVLAAVLAAAPWAEAAGGKGSRAAVWPALRGPLGSGAAPAGDPPVSWSETENVRWKTRLPGPGHASPVVWGNRIYVLAAVETRREVPADAEADVAAPEPERSSAAGHDDVLPARAAPQEQRRRRGRRERTPPPTRIHRFVVIAIDRDSGEIVWETVVREEVPHEPGHETASQASASPVTDGKRIYAFFGSRGLYALDRKGRVLWDVDLGDMTTRNQFGEGASPALHGNTLVVNWDHEGDSFIAAFDKRSGKRLWQVDRDEPTSWSTPLIVEDGGRALAIVSATNRTRAYDLKTGEEVWSCGGLGLNVVPAPVERDGTVFVMSGYRDPAAMAIRYRGAAGDITESDRVLWRIESGTSYVPSPVLHDGQVYFLERFKAVLATYDLATGEQKYEKQRVGELGNIYASPVAAAGRIYFLDRNGSAAVVRAGREFEILAENKLDDAFDATPAVAGDTLILRGHAWLYSIGR